MFSNLIDRVGNHNPQLFREIKGKMTSGKVIATAMFSIIAQLTLYFGFIGQLPSNLGYPKPFLNRYCTGTYRLYQGSECVKNLLGQWEIHWELWWLDLFFGVSLAGFFILLVVGIYLLIIDLIQEDKKGTLNFIRLSPIKAKDFFIGKMFGVPSLVLLFIGLAMPLHFWAALHSNIGIRFILAFYILVGLSSAFFYSLALLFASITRNYAILSAFVSTAIIFFILLITTPSIIGFDFDYVLAFAVFNPLILLNYPIEPTLRPAEISIGSIGTFHHILWYGQAIWNKYSGMFFTLSLNFIWWTYIIQKGLERIYNTPKSTIFSKMDSYVITSSFVFIWFGFVPESLSSGSDDIWAVWLFQFSLCALFFLMIPAITPDRQTLLDWSRYRHYNSKSFLKDLIVGEKSPSVVAIMINSLLVFSYLVVPLVLFLPHGSKISGLLSLISQMTTLCIFALIIQLILTMKLKHKGIAITLTLFMLSIFSIVSIFYLDYITRIILDIIKVDFNYIFFGSILTLDFLVFASFALVLQKRLQKFGQSETKALLN